MKKISSLIVLISAVISFFIVLIGIAGFIWIIISWPLTIKYILDYRKATDEITKKAKTKNALISFFGGWVLLILVTIGWFAFNLIGQFLGISITNLKIK